MQGYLDAAQWSGARAAARIGNHCARVRIVSALSWHETPLIELLRTLRVVKYAAWLALRWQDPAFPEAFPWFASARFWSEHLQTLREQVAALQEQDY